MDISTELAKQIQACKTEEELIALAAENDVELSLEEAKEFFAERAEGELADEELENVAGGVGCPPRNAHKRVEFCSKDEVKFIFNIGDRPQIFRNTVGGRTLTAEITDRKPYTPSGVAWFDVYKVKTPGGFHPGGDHTIDDYFFRDRFEV